MQVPLQISFRDMAPSPAIEARIREKAARLERFFDRIIGCRVIVEEKNRHQRKGKLYNVRVEVTVPGKDVFVGHVGPQDHAHEDVYVAIRDAFDAVRRRLEDYERRRRGDVKHHESQPHGRVVELHPEEDSGRIETDDGRVVYFHRNSIIGADIGQLALGTEVRFVEEMGERGPQASTVHVVGRHHPA